MNWRRDRDNWELLGREVEGLEEKRWVMVVGTGVISMILRPLSLDDTCLHANWLRHVLPTNFSSLVLVAVGGPRVWVGLQRWTNTSLGRLSKEELVVVPSGW